MKGLYNQVAEYDTKKDFTKRDRLIMKYAPLVKYIAHRIAMRLPPQIEVDDLINSGILGLMDAIEKFDPAKDHLSSGVLNGMDDHSEIFKGAVFGNTVF